MREILFRGRRTDNGEWVYGTPLYLTHEKNKNHKFVLIVPIGTEFGCSELDEHYEVRPETVGEFTGMHDKNGKKIFEGDFINLPRWVVSYSNGMNDCYEMPAGWYFQRDNWDSWSELQHPDDQVVIGNIHDNPELLKTNY